MKIMLAVDGSSFSDAAVYEVAARPWPMGCAVKVISAVRLPFTPTDETRSIPDSDYSRMEKVGMERANESITKALANLSARKADLVTIESAAIIGDARQVILDEAEKWEADLLVLGSRGLGGFKRFLLGSVALGVLTNAPCSVRIVRRQAPTGGGTGMKILLAVDGSPYSLAAANEVARRPWPKGSSVKIVHAAERSPILPQVEPALPEIILSQMQTVENAMGAGARLAVESKILHGYPKNVILDEAEKWEADLIVLGARGLNAIDRLLLGSVSNAVATHAKCSVEIVRRPPGKDIIAE